MKIMRIVEHHGDSDTPHYHLIGEDDNLINTRNHCAVAYSERADAEEVRQHFATCEMCADCFGPSRIYTTG